MIGLKAPNIELYCWLFVQFSDKPFVLELSSGLGHVVLRDLNRCCPSLVRGAYPDGAPGDVFFFLKFLFVFLFFKLTRCLSRFWTQVVM